MTRLTRQVDQYIAIGREIVVGPTDIDERTVRVIARGKMFGGPNDGGTFDSVHELSKGQSFSIGDAIVVTLLEIAGKSAKFGVLPPPKMLVGPQEQSSAS